MSRTGGIGRRIAEARKTAGLSQSELATATGNSTNTIQSWEANRRHPRIDALQLLADSLDRDVAWFFETDQPTTGRNRCRSNPTVVSVGSLSRRVASARGMNLSRTGQRT
jgi:transcriptional regulator with XRE-family HTH domain